MLSVICDELQMASASVRSALYQDFLNNMLREVTQRQFDSHLVRDFERRSDDRHRLHLMLESIEAALNTEVHVEATIAYGHISAVTGGRHKRECRHAEERIRIVIGSEDGERKVRIEAVRELSRHAVLREYTPVVEVTIGSQSTLHSHGTKTVLHAAAHRLYIHQSDVAAVCARGSQPQVLDTSIDAVSERLAS